MIMNVFQELIKPLIDFKYEVQYVHTLFLAIMVILV